MRPLILEYSEQPLKGSVDFGLIEYCPIKNLSMVKGTSKEAISYVNLETDTFTKTEGEESDSDRDLRQNIKLLMGTRTDTYAQVESSDLDRNFFGMQQLLDTRTTLESEAKSDSDR